MEIHCLPQQDCLIVTKVGTSTASWEIHDMFHISLLLPYHETAAHRPNYSRPPPEIIKGKEEYTIERIISHQVNKQSKCVEYLIKWQGYPVANSTWEPLKHIHASGLFKAYHRQAGIKAATAK